MSKLSVNNPSQRYDTLKKSPLVIAMALAGCLGLASIQGCSNDTQSADMESTKVELAASLITASTVKNRAIEDTVSSMGQITSISTPKISAEVAGRIIAIYKDIGKTVAKGEIIAKIDPQLARLGQTATQANVKRLEAILTNQESILKRNQQLLEKGFISNSRFDDVEAQLIATKEQIVQAKANHQSAVEQLSKTDVRSSVDGQIIKRLISIGDYASRGKPLFEISTSQKLQVVLLFPEAMSSKFKQGQTVRLSTPTNPNEIAAGQITEILSAIDASNRSIRIVVEVENPGHWKPGASVRGEVVLNVKEQALVVPAQAVVLRPAGQVVYIIEDNFVKQRIVVTGQTIDGHVEILEGVNSGERIANDGAGFLADNARIRIQGVN
ncbi:MAG: efflux transporter periplasmic adaptor subunit [Moraxellaceae bacterium]|nr:MAG: efflux transporter periplasmic adaptor subunit [Moraxellaceae bacterium]